MWESNRIIGGKYEIQRCIGRGGMSRVYLARDKRLGKQWALKEIEVVDGRGNLEQKSLLREARLMKRLDHPALPRIVDILEEGNWLYIVMDYVKGEPLSHIVKNQGTLEERQVLDVAIQAAQVLVYLHGLNPPVIYRDMKPANMILQSDGKIKFIDFGIARVYKPGKEEDTEPLGTVGFASPEQFGGRGQSDGRSDIYSLGMTMYYLLTGEHPPIVPHRISSPGACGPFCLTYIGRILEKCTRSDPGRRYTSSQELLRALENCRRGKHLWKRGRKRVILLSVAGIWSTLIMGMLVGSQWRKNTYQNLLDRGEKEVRAETQRAYYLQAVSVMKGETEAYVRLLEVYQSDGDFTLEEERELKTVLYENNRGLKKSKDYGKLAYKIGRLYWYYYSYGEGGLEANQLTRMKSSITWFEEALPHLEENAEEYTTAQVYRSIGKFNKEIFLEIHEGQDKGRYREYWESLEEMKNFIEETQEELTEQEFACLVLFAIESYGKQITADGIPVVRMKDMVQWLKKEMKTWDGDTRRTKDRKEYVMRRIPQVMEIMEELTED